MKHYYVELTNEYKNLLQSKYSILDHVSICAFDHDFPLLERWLGRNKKSIYNANDRIIIEHFDTDYYLSGVNYGLALYNLFTVFKKLDIPFFTMLIVTNHFGIEQEIKQLALDPYDRPTVIETFVSTLHYTNNYQDQGIDADSIIRPGLCMMGTGRVHRHAMYRFIESKLQDHVAVSMHLT
jgi:hypothetical protein